MWDLLGLNDADEAVYRHDLSHPGSTVRQVSRATGLSEDRVGISRGRLIACGLLRREQSGEIRATPSGPALIAERLRSKLDAEHARRRREVSQFHAEMSRLINEHLLAPSGTTPRPQVDRLPSIDAAAVRIAELLRDARTEVARVKPATDSGRRCETDLIMPAEVRAAGRGVDLRMIYPPTQLLSPAIRRVVDHEVRSGISVRSASTPATNVTIVDRSVAVLIDPRHDGGQHILLVREDLLVHTLHHLFETFWAHASDVATVLSGGEGEPIVEVTAEERLVLQLLSDGLKDEAVAKRLGISVRTVRRKISYLLRRLRADSRFQAGALAAQRGWLHHSQLLCCPSPRQVAHTAAADRPRRPANAGSVPAGSLRSPRGGPIPPRQRQRKDHG